MDMCKALAHVIFWHILGHDHREPRLISLELDEMPCLEEDLVIVLLVFHEGIGIVLMQELKT